MGLYADLKLEVEKRDAYGLAQPLTKDDWRRLRRALLSRIGDMVLEPFEEGDEQLCGSANDVSCTWILEDTVEVSKQMPGFLLSMEVCGFSYEGFTTIYAIDGKAHEVEGEVIYPEFNPDALESVDTMIV